MGKSMKVMMVDPPSGWRYGFPKPLPTDLPEGESIVPWLLSEGYPQSEIDACGKYFYCRYWEQEVDGGWYEGRAARDNMSSPGDRDYD